MMTRNERAKQFMPFDGVKGFREAIAEVERRHACLPPRELSEDVKSQIDRALQKIKRGTPVRVDFYNGQNESRILGRVTDVDAVFGFLYVGDVRIPFERLYGLVMVTDRDVPLFGNVREEVPGSNLHA